MCSSSLPPRCFLPHPWRNSSSPTACHGCEIPFESGHCHFSISSPPTPSPHTAVGEVEVGSPARLFCGGIGDQRRGLLEAAGGKVEPAEVKPDLDRHGDTGDAVGGAGEELRRCCLDLRRRSKERHHPLHLDSGRTGRLALHSPIVVLRWGHARSAGAV